MVRERENDRKEEEEELERERKRGWRDTLVYSHAFVRFTLALVSPGDLPTHLDN